MPTSISLISITFFIVPTLFAIVAGLAPHGVLLAAPDDRISLTIYKSRRKMHLQRGKETVKVFRVFLGSSPLGHKLQQGDNKTPEGNYRVVDKKIGDKFHRFIGIDYPNAHDAELAFQQGRITAWEKARIKRAVYKGIRPPADTVLGGHLGIHGIGDDEDLKLKLIEEMDWTNGCIAVTNAEIRELYQKLPIGTLVRIRK